MTPHTCPVCNGQGKVSRPPYIPGNQESWMSSDPFQTFDCRACTGTGIVWEHTPEAVNVPRPCRACGGLPCFGTQTGCRG